MRLYLKVSTATTTSNCYKLRDQQEQDKIQHRPRTYLLSNTGFPAYLQYIAPVYRDLQVNTLIRLEVSEASSLTIYSRVQCRLLILRFFQRPASNGTHPPLFSVSLRIEGFGQPVRKPSPARLKARYLNTVAFASLRVKELALSYGTFISTKDNQSNYLTYYPLSNPEVHRQIKWGPRPKPKIPRQSLNFWSPGERDPADGV